MYQVQTVRDYGHTVIQPTGPVYGVVLHDHEVIFHPVTGEGMCRLEGEPWNLPLLPARIDAPQGLPETVKLYESTYVKLTENLQWFWFDLLVRNNPSMTLEELKKAWSNLTHGARAFTNKKGWNDGYCDFINEVNMGAEPMGFEPIITGGNIIKIVGTLTNKGGSPHWPIEVLLPTNVTNADRINRNTHPEWVAVATNVRRERVSWGTRKVIRFPQLEGADVPVPIFSKAYPNFIRAERVRVLPPGQPFPSPYNPAIV